MGKLKDNLLIACGVSIWIGIIVLICFALGFLYHWLPWLFWMVVGGGVVGIIVTIIWLSFCYQMSQKW